MDRLIVMPDMMTDFQKQRDRKLSHRVRPVGRYVADRNTQFLSGGGINYIVARGQYADKLKLRTLLQDLPTERNFIGINGLGISNTAADFLSVCFCPLIDCQFAQLPQAVPAQIPRVLCISI